MADSFADAFQRLAEPGGKWARQCTCSPDSDVCDFCAGNRAPTQPIRELHGESAATHVALEAAAKKVEEANRILTDAQHDFRKALAAHMAALTGTKVNP